MAIAFGKIANALQSAASDHILGISQDIYDTTLNAYQSDLNLKVKQLYTTVNDEYPLLLTPPGQTADSNTTTYFSTNVTINPNLGKITALRFVKPGGKSTEFLKADGSIDSNTYITSTSLNDYVTLNTNQTITGLKTFESNSSTTGVSLILKNKGWAASMSTAMDFYNGNAYSVPNARIETKMVKNGTSGGTLIFYTQGAHASTNPNPNGLTERFRIGDDGLTKVTGDFSISNDLSVSNDLTVSRYLKVLGRNITSNSTSKFYIVPGTSAIYLEAGNNDFTDNVPLYITGYNGNAGGSLYLRYSNIYTRDGYYINIDSGNYTSYTPILNSSSEHATNTSVIYAPTTAGTSGQYLMSNGSGAPTWTSLTTLKNPYSLKLKDAEGTTVSYDGSAAINLSGGVYDSIYAKYIKETSVSNGTNVSEAKANLLEASKALGKHCGFLTSRGELITHWTDDDFVWTMGGTGSFFKIGGGYTDSYYSTWLVSNVTESHHIGIVRQNNSVWTNIRYLAWTSDIPTKVSQLENDDRGYIGTTSVQATSKAQALTGINNITPSATSTYSLGNSSTYWDTVYTNTVFIGGSANNTTAKITSDTTTNMVFYVSGQAALVINSSEKSVRPGLSYNDQYTLGTTSSYFKNLYATNIYKVNTPNNIILANNTAISPHLIFQRNTSSDTYNDYHIWGEADGIKFGLSTTDSSNITWLATLGGTNTGLTANKFVIPDGTASQVLKADGSVEDLSRVERKTFNAKNDGWYRIGTLSTTNHTFGLFTITKGYSNYPSESYLIAIGAGRSATSVTAYNSEFSINLLSGQYPIRQYIQKVRLSKLDGYKTYIEVYITFNNGNTENFQITNMNSNIILQTPELITETPETYKEMSLVKGIKTSDKFYGNLEGNSSNGVFYIEGTGTTAGKWLGTHDDIKELYKGLTIAYKIPIAGASPTTLNINNLGEVTCYKESNSYLTTHYGVGSVILLVYDGTYFRISDYDNLHQCDSYCTTSGSSATKTASATYYKLRTGNLFICSLYYDNTAASALTLNVNSTGAKPIYINGTASSSTNYTLPGGRYLVYYDGTNYYFYTNGGVKIPQVYGNAETSTSVKIQTLVADSDLNTLTTDGIYGTIATSVCRSLINAPTDRINGEARLEISTCGNSSHVFQTLYAKLSNSYDIWIRSGTTDSFSAWSKILTSSNYNSYSPKLDGTGATGTWNINIGGSAATLTTSRTIWGQSFNGSANIDGDITIIAGDTDKSIKFLSAISGYYNWRIAYIGTGAGDTNYLSFESSKSTTSTWEPALQLACSTLNATFAGQVTAPNFIQNSNGTSDFTSGTLKIKALNVLTTATGSTYGTGTSGQILRSNGTNVYWSNLDKLTTTTLKTNQSYSLKNDTWTDTGYSISGLDTGTYMIQVTSTNLVASGVFSVQKSLTDTAGDEIPLHVYSSAGWRPYLRTNGTKLEISANNSSAVSRTVTIKIVQII